MLKVFTVLVKETNIHYTEYMGLYTIHGLLLTSIGSSRHLEIIPSTYYPKADVIFIVFSLEILTVIFCGGASFAYPLSIIYIL